MKKLTQLQIFQQLEAGKKIRFVAFGASNTQRYMPGTHWFDYVEMGFKNRFGGDCGQFINSGVGGHTTLDLLARFQHDVADYQPDTVILTIGGNDCNPAKNISPEQFRTNLRQIYDQIAALGAEVVFQTYYACDAVNMDPERYKLMVQNMEMVRQVARETSNFLVDNFARWETLRQLDEATYRLLMLNAMHVNALGNAVIGLDLMRDLELPLRPDYRTQLSGGLFAQKLLDQVNQ